MEQRGLEGELVGSELELEVEVTIWSCGVMFFGGDSVIDARFDVLLLRGMCCNSVVLTSTSSGGELRSSISIDTRISLTVIFSK